MKSKPKVIDLGFDISEPKLWQLSIPAEVMSLKVLENNLDIPYLEKEGTDDWNMTPRMLIENYTQEMAHAGKTEKSDLSYPIHIYFNKNQWIILDGVHRYVKTIRNGAKTIEVKKVSPENLIRSEK